MLRGKTIVLGVTGSIAAYKIASLASALKKQHADIYVIMTKNATQFITPVTFETLTGHKCLVDTFDRNFEFNVAHISLADKADVMMIAPASANVIGKLANGIADDMLTTTAMAMECPVIISPAMNTKMFNNHIVQQNLSKLEELGKIVIPPDTGYLACGTTGAGKMPSEDVLMKYILREVAGEKDLKGKKILVTAGPTRESLDPVRFISNHSSGKMGYAIAEEASLRGAEVTLISGPVSIEPPMFVNVINVESAEDMFEAVKENYADQDMIIKAAAVADYTPSEFSEQKIKKKDDDLKLPLKRTSDILAWLGENRKEGQVIAGFAMETENVIENARAKLEKKNVDMICANSLKEEGAGFAGDTNHLILIKRDGETEVPMMTKREAAGHLLDELIKEGNK